MTNSSRSTLSTLIIFQRHRQSRNRSSRRSTLVQDFQPRLSLSGTEVEVLFTYLNYDLILVIDSGAEVNLISYETVQRFNMKIYTATQLVTQADGITPLPVAGEVHIQLCRGTCNVLYAALAVHCPREHVLAEMSFLEDNNIINIWGLRLMIS